MRRKTSSSHRYRLRNWPDYNTALVARGSLTLWCDEAVLAGWVARGRTGRRGRPRTYSDLAITCMLTLQAVYHLPLRATTGLVRSLLQLLGVAALPCADAATLSRRRRTLAVRLPVRAPRGPLHLVVDSTGLKVYGEGEWKVRQHGWSYYRTWRKVHLAIDVSTRMVRVAALTTADVSDGQCFPPLLAAERAPIAQVTGDGSYDEWRSWDAVAARPEHPRAVFPLRHGPERHARIRQHGNRAAPPLDRDTHLRHIRAVGRAQWKHDVGYHQRSLAETTVARLKGLFGPRLSARAFPGQATEVFVRCAALNRMTLLGMPDAVRVA